ncbi:hypothetical protein BCR43DRAFT_497594 [Syncephalastrum racemosum]|uniref:Uncharacterized protein n=1 Tax=Syncephalastrum racemosum TaxID=13706 RepID=A0A1X2H2F8_SYNRA|nr:hypothetical protein BCR43DRAFT_497594 [Syncephalastrum racemosum]
MQWRAPSLLLCGLAVIYLASLLQDTPYPHPAKIATIDPAHLPFKPDAILLSSNDKHIYLTALLYDTPMPGFGGKRHGTGPLKTGVAGRLLQWRKPMNAVTHQSYNEAATDSAATTTESFHDQEEWTQTFDHILPGVASKYSQAPHDPSMQFAVMYHVVHDQMPRHYVRIYSYQFQGGFRYRDVQLPGTTWIHAFSLERNALIYSRDPDWYRFRTAAIPPGDDDVIIESSEPGDPIKPYHQPRNTEYQESVMCRIFSPVNETFRVFSLDLQKTDRAIHMNVTIADNATTQLSELRGKSSWQTRERDAWEQLIFSDEPVEYMGFTDMSQYQTEQMKVKLPSVRLARASQGKTLVFPYTQTQFWTLDYIEPTGDDVHQEEYYWLKDEVYDSDIVGVEVNDQGNLLAVWTESNIIYIYKRGAANTKHVPRRVPSLLNRVDQWLDVAIPDTLDDEEERHVRERRKRGLPLDWRLRMAITAKEGELGSVPVSAVHFRNDTKHDDTRQRNFIFVALKSGSVRTFLLDEIEELKEVNLWSFATDHWDMLSVMCTVIGIFVLNEYQHYS